MLFLLVLVAASGVAWFLPVKFGGRSLQDAACRGMAIAFVVSGLSHFVLPQTFLGYFPGWAPFPMAVVILTGVVEVVGGLALLIRRYRRPAGIALAAYLVLVFPANVYAAVAGIEEGLPGLPEAEWYPWVRLPLQVLFVWWVLWSTTTTPSTLDPSGAARWWRTPSLSAARE